MKIFDGHNDILNKINHSEDPRNTRAFLERGEGHLDFPRATKAGFAGGFFAVYSSDPPSVSPFVDRKILTDDGFYFNLSPPLSYEYAHQTALSMIDLLFNIENDSSGKFQVVLTSQELENCLENEIMAAILHLEGAEPILPSLENLPMFYEKGMRSLGITWSRPNAFGHGVPFLYPGSPDTGHGLTQEGKNLIKACGELGILIDLAHLNEKGFWDTADLYPAPLVSTHTAAHGLIPKPRNLTDIQLKAIAETNGVVGVIFSINDLDGGPRPIKDAPISSIIKHIRYIADLIGPEHVAFGSDLDGTLIPPGLGDVSGFPKLIDLLIKDGFSQDELEGICYRNWLRVIKETWKT